MNYASEKYENYIRARVVAGKHTFVFRGGRRSGKTFAILLTLLAYSCQDVPIVSNVASMTIEQGRLGAYSDCKTIIESEPYFRNVFECLSSPREIRNKINGSRLHFNSYKNSETAKGIACDFLFVNEANNFTKQQYTDLRANVRRGVFLDFNPNIKFWVDDYFDDTDILDTTWQDNRYLTDAQLEYFDELYRLAHKPNASAIDIRNYKIYYKGEYSELKGSIFTSDNLQFVKDVPQGLRNFITFSDPSALRGADWFANVLSAQDKEGNIYILDAFSVNIGAREKVVRALGTWGRSYDISNYYVETNGLVGIDFYEFAQNSGLPVSGWYSKGNKFDRICANYQDITNKVFFVDTPTVRSYLEQVYEFAQNCEHDDNIDAVNSSVMAQKIFSTW